MLASGLDKVVGTGTHVKVGMDLLMGRAREKVLGKERGMEKARVRTTARAGQLLVRVVGIGVVVNLNRLTHHNLHEAKQPQQHRLCWVRGVQVISQMGGEAWEKDHPTNHSQPHKAIPQSCSHPPRDHIPFFYPLRRLTIFSPRPQKLGSFPCE